VLTVFAYKTKRFVAMFDSKVTDLYQFTRFLVMQQTDLLSSKCLDTLLNETEPSAHTPANNALSCLPTVCSTFQTMGLFRM
jgi:hypothetical protein